MSDVAVEALEIEQFCVAHQCRMWGFPDNDECTFQRYQRAVLGAGTGTACRSVSVSVVPAAPATGWVGITDAVLQAALRGYDKAREEGWGHADAMSYALGAAEERDES